MSLGSDDDESPKIDISDSSIGNVSLRDTIDRSTTNNIGTDPTDMVLSIVDALRKPDDHDNDAVADMVDKLVGILQQEIIRLRNEHAEIKKEMKSVYEQRNKIAELLVKTQALLDACSTREKRATYVIWFIGLVVWSLMLRFL